MRVSKITDVIITSPDDPEYIAGLVGLCLTLEGIESSTFDVGAWKKPYLFDREYTSNKVMYKLWWRGVDLQSHAPNQTVGTDQTFDIYKKLRQSLRFIRVWGPPGLYKALSPSLRLTARLRKLCLEIVEIPELSEGMPLVPNLLSRWDPCLELYVQSATCTRVSNDASPDPGNPLPKKRRLEEENDIVENGEKTEDGREKNAHGGDKENDDGEEENDKEVKNDGKSGTRNPSRVYSIPLICGRGRKQLGKFLVEKAKALNIPPGKDFAKLKSGETVTLKDGRVIQPLDVCEPSVEGVPYIILNCSGEDDVRCIQTLPGFAQRCREFGTRGGLIINMSSAEANVPERLLGSKLFGDLRNQIVNVQCSENSCYAEHLSGIKPLESDMQPPPILFINTQLALNEIPASPFIDQQALIKALSTDLPDLFAHNEITCPKPSWFGRRIPMIPSAKVYTALVTKRAGGRSDNKMDCIECLDIASSADKVSGDLLSSIRKNNADLASFETSFKQLRRQNMLTHTCAITDSIPADLSVTLLGTGAAVPSKFRNVSSTLLRFGDDFSVLCDCGEGTLVQIFQATSAPQAQRLVQSIRCVFISHKHGDHINGLPEFSHYQYKRGDRRCDKLTIVAPDEMFDWCRRTCAPHHFIACEDFLVGLTPVLTSTGLSLLLRTAYVDHVGRFNISTTSFGARFRVTPGPASSHCDELQKLGNVLLEMTDERVAVSSADNLVSGGASTCVACRQHIDIGFSGDLSPTPDFSRLIEGVDILIHEATFEDELAHEAVARKHCTVSHCVEAGLSSRCRALIMTHFSQRYPSIPRIRVPVGSLSPAIIAFGMDFLRVPMTWCREADLSSVGEAFRTHRKVIASLQENLVRLTADDDA
ncbi:putative ribonuclease Z [Gregarina niphandrodes]|uniref:ribonuclease Z n=1 Tax=Gregarina niphandrodes TaxID=110365 RepID=A0A023B504_GRENI|nr:putative ribonuclease Z [Gregarina niphandrodes]EZG57884.1 putative ribonuclease Z [Gregarina niphandrodes]|eukprot:XP_011131005.1 putative ribonuclease Z [Gregarina niphandrodes]